MKFPSGTRHDNGTTSSTFRDAGARCSSQLMSLSDSPSDMMNPDHTGCSTAVDVQTEVRHVSDCGLPRVPCVVTKFADIALLVAKLED